jgi:hypothetical protein
VKNGFKYLGILILSLIVIGCGASQYIKTINTEDSCQVYVFRDSFVLLYSFDVEIDEKAYAKLSDETYTNLYLPSGKHIVSAYWFPSSGGVDLDVPITCNPKETLYLAFTGEVEGMGGGFRRKIYALSLTKEAANKRMGKYKKVGL